MGPCTASIAAVSIATLCTCATFRSPTLLLGSFCHSCCMASHCCCPPPPHCGSKHWFWPRDWPNE
ncbi:unnamed protein product [Staurois parvus]|uniref:Secreted protein n=1 Tax=Staurois parvus TaxID=386267 RepID=A0ABN9H1W4_9NEOB|nr:unnamed protein product [Staurois parvus]